MHPSDSAAQRTAEAALLLQLGEQLGFPVLSERIHFENGSHVHVDGINREHRYICEIFCRIGTLQAAQVEKVASDILKLTLVERMLGGEWRKVLCFADERAAAVLRGRSWLATAANVAHFEVAVVALPDVVHQSVLDAQRRQFMINKPVVGDGDG